MLLDHLTAAGQDEGGVVLVAGEPGVGKTRLLAELAAHAQDAGWQVLSGRAYDSEGMPPYLPFVEALRGYIRGVPVETLQALLGSGADDLALLVPELASPQPNRPAVPSLTPEQQRYWLFEHVADFLLALARSRAPGMLLVLDDLHWADAPTLYLLLHLARRIGGAPILLAGAHRTVDRDRADPLAGLLAGLSREHLVHQISLAPFSHDEAGTLVAALTTKPPAPAVVDAIYRRTEGNAYFVEEVVRRLHEGGGDLNDPQRVVELAVPESIRQVIDRRLARLSQETQRMLQTAAVLGDDIMIDVLGMGSGLASAPLLDALDDAMRAGLLTEVGDRYQFRHALVRQTILADLRLHRRQRLHLRIARALEATTGGRSPESLATLATHYRLAGPTADPEKALIYSRRAGDAAAAVFAWEQAIRYRQAALDQLDGDGGSSDRAVAAQRCELLLALGEAQARAGDILTALETYLHVCGLARTLPTPDLFARGALAYGELPRNRAGEVEQLRVDLLEEAIRAIGEDATALRARLQSCLALSLYWSNDPERRASLSHAALVTARQIADPATLAYILSRRHQVLISLNRFDTRLAVADELVRIGEQLRDPEIVRQGHFWRINDLLELGQLTEAEGALDAHGHLADELRLPFFQMTTVQWRAVWALFGGRIEESDRLTQESLAMWQKAYGDRWNQMAFLHRIGLRRAQGRLAEIETEVQSMATRRPITPLYRTLPAYVHSLMGCESQAREEFAALAGHDFADLLGSSYLINTVTYLAEICTVLRDRDRAPVLYELLRPFAGFNGVNWAYPNFSGAFDHYLGLLATTMGDWDAAARHFDDALAMHTRMGARLFLARTQQAYATLLCARNHAGDLLRARSLLGLAAAAFEDMGMLQNAGVVRVMLADLADVNAPPARANHPDGLSARELDVLRLIAAGKSNREIAEALVISYNTVERHINHIFAKTGVANRVEAATYAQRHGIAG
jgi:DNA-binding CsgD family transcriptional regulator